VSQSRTRAAVTSTPHKQPYGVNSDNYTSYFILKTNTASSQETPPNFVKKTGLHTSRYGNIYTITETVWSSVGGRLHGIIKETRPRNGKTMTSYMILSTRKKMVSLPDEP